MLSEDESLATGGDLHVASRSAMSSETPWYCLSSTTSCQHLREEQHSIQISWSEGPRQPPAPHAGVPRTQQSLS